MSRSTAVLVAALLALGFGGCTGGSDGGSSGTSGAGGSTPATGGGDATGGGEANGAGGTASTTPPPAGGTATLRGTVKLEGQPKEMQSLLRLMTRDAACVEMHDPANPPKAETVVVGENGALANVFVYISKGVAQRYPAPSDAVVLDQKGCIYTPHVVGVQVGQPVAVKNSDNTLHNINIQSKSSALNKGQPASSAPIETKFKRPEVMVPVKCDVHPWMNAWIGVVEHPFFAVSSLDGTFEVATKLPAGTYTVTAWHEAFGTSEQEITVAENQETVEVSFTFQAK